MSVAGRAIRSHDLKSQFFSCVRSMPYLSSRSRRLCSEQYISGKTASYRVERAAAAAQPCMGDGLKVTGNAERKQIREIATENRSIFLIYLDFNLLIAL